MIHPSLIKFIEDHIEWIDNNQWEDFWNEVVQRFLNNTTIRQLVYFLEDAGIETRSIRLKLLDEQIESVIANMYIQTLRYKFTISQFIDEIRVDRRFGFNLNEIIDYIIETKDKRDVEIWYENNDWYIRRHKR